jgi:hypothetical protein
MVIHYCDQCGQRVAEADLQAGLARLSPEGKAFCGKCAAPAGSSPPAGVRRRDSQANLPPAAAAHARPAPRKPAEPKPRSIVPALVVGLVVVVVIGIVLGIVLAGPSRTARADKAKKDEGPVPSRKVVTPRPSAPAPSGASSPAVSGSPSFPSAPVVPTAPPAPSPASPPPVEAKAAEESYDPRSEVGNSLLAQAQAFLKANQDDVWGYRDKLEHLKEGYKGTKAGAEAARLLSGLKLPEVDPNTHPPPTAEAAWAQAVQVLPAADPGKDARKGRWTFSGGTLRSDRSTWAQTALPYLLPEEYDLRLTCARVESDDCLLIVLARRGRPFIFSIGSGNKHCSLETVHEKRKDLLPTKLVRPGVLTNGQRTQLVVQVRSQCLRAYVNGKPIVGCQVDDEGLSLAPELRMPQANQLGLCTWNSVYEFYACEVIEITGKGQFTR